MLIGYLYWSSINISNSGHAILVIGYENIIIIDIWVLVKYLYL